MDNLKITEEMMERYYVLDQQKKQIESEMKQLKKTFHTYFDNELGAEEKGEMTNGKYKLQRQIRKSEKLNEDKTVALLEELNLKDLIKIEKKPDEEKIEAAIQLGLITETDLADCKIGRCSKAISVKKVF